MTLGGATISNHGDEASNQAGRPVRRSISTGIATFAALITVGALLAACSSNSTTPTTSTTAASTSTTAKSMSTTAVKALQTGLAKVGCYTGPIDGVLGTLTTNAVKDFQASAKLAVDGVDGPKTAAKLALDVATGSKVCTTSSTTTSSTTSSSTTTTTGSGSTVPAAATSAINAYETANGPAAGTWVLVSSSLSTVDPTYVYFRIGPAAGYENTVQGGYGFAHNAGGSWSVIGFGSAGVGCPPGAGGNQVVPANVLAGFGVSCPTT
jgi:peptidoglycan hydrolase-like protein with peptidoglycan-binding domain